MARLHAIMGAVAGLVIGAFLGQLALLPVVVIMRGAGWDEFPNGAAILLGMVLVCSCAVAGARIGVKVAADFDQERAEAAAEPLEPRRWAGRDWALTVATDLVELESPDGPELFLGEGLARIHLRGAGHTWFLYLPDDTVRPLAGLGPAEAAEIRACLARL